MTVVNRDRFSLVTSRNSALDDVIITSSLHQIDQNGIYFHYEVGVSLHTGPLMVQIVSSANIFRIDFSGTLAIDPLLHTAIGSFYLPILSNIRQDGIYTFPDNIHPPGIECAVSMLSSGDSIGIVIGR